MRSDEAVDDGALGIGATGIGATGSGATGSEAVDDTLGPTRFRLGADRRADTAEQRSLRRDLSVATTERHFLMHYQPRIKFLPGQLPAVEALLRWPHRKRGMMSPATFLPLAEQTGHIVEIGGWALRQACRDAVAWPSLTVVSVNVARRQLVEGVLASQVAAALADSGLDPECLELELEESLLLDADTELMLTLSAIRDLGVGLVVDEFGAGSASLAILKRLPLTGLKIDRSFTRALPENGEDEAIVRAVVTVSHTLGLAVCAEGIETPAQVLCAEAAGCDEAQGHLFSQAVTAARLPEVMRGLSRRRLASNSP